MNLSTLINEALKNLLSNKVRSLLTMLGIFIGVGAVIAMMAVGFGAKNAISKDMSSLGTNTVYVTPGNFSASLWNPKSLTNSDAEAIRSLPSIERVSAMVMSSSQVSRAGNKSTNLQFQGVTPDFLMVGSVKLAEGQFITQQNVDSNEMVVVIGPQVRNLFFSADENPIGETLRILGQPYTIVGVMAKADGAQTGMSDDKTIYLPLSTVQNRVASSQRSLLSQVQAVFKSGYDTNQVEKEITNLLRERHQIKAGDPNDFSVFNMQKMVDTMNSVMGTFVLFLGGVAGISLLVGGIGIMNIMLVTVTERTKEIGLRKALGAKQKDILIQFLVESSVLSLVGGILGIIMGLLLATAIAAIASSAGTKITIVVEPMVIVGSTLFSILVGLFFGIYPANRASKLEPVIALRTE